MPETSVTQPSFIQGVSTQSETQRQQSTAAEIINGYLDVARGLSKRNGLKFREALSDLINKDDEYSIFWAETGGKQFVMFFSDNGTTPIQIYDIAEGRQFIPTYDANTKAYITAGTSAKDKWRVLSIFDSSIIVNTEVTTALTGNARDTNNFTIDKTFVDYQEAAVDGYFVSTNANNKIQFLNSNIGFPAGYYEVISENNQADFDATFPKINRLRSPDDNYKLDETTMPVQMVFDPSSGTHGEFTVKFPDWAERKSGNKDTNPGPSFIGRQLTDIVFHRGRFWFFADETVNASSSFDIFNFFQNDAGTLTESDPISEFLSDEGLNKVVYAVPFSRSLSVFTEGNRQFEIRSDGPMTPASIAIIPTSNYGVNRGVRPIRLGNQMYFFTAYTDYGQLFEYFFRENAATNVATDVTQQVRDYILDDIENMSGEVNNGVLVSHANDTTRSYIYKTLWSGTDKLQSGWSTWNFPDFGYTIQSSKVFGDNIWFVLKVDHPTDGVQYILATVAVQAEEQREDFPYSIHLDFAVNKAPADATYDAQTNKTSWSLPYKYEGKITAIPTTEEGAGLSVATTTTTTGTHETQVFVTGDWSDRNFVIGIPFDFKTVLNPPYVKDQNNNPVTGSFAVKKLILYIRNAVQFTLNQTVPGLASTATKKYTSTQMSAAKIPYDTVPVTEFDNPTFIVLGRADNMTLSIEDTSEFPLTLVSAEFRGFFNARRPVQ